MIPFISLYMAKFFAVLSPAFPLLLELLIFTAIASTIILTAGLISILTVKTIETLSPLFHRVFPGQRIAEAQRAAEAQRRIAEAQRRIAQAEQRLAEIERAAEARRIAAAERAAQAAEARRRDEQRREEHLDAEAQRRDEQRAQRREESERNIRRIREQIEARRRMDARLLESPIEEVLVHAATIGDHASVNRILALPAARAHAAGGQNLALIRAIENGHHYVVLLLLGNAPAVSAHVAANNNQAIIEAVRHNHFQIVQTLANQPLVATHITALNSEVLRSCAEVGNAEMLRFLLNTFPALQRTAADNENAALCIAAANGHADIVRELLTLECVVEQINAQENFAYRIAQINRHDEVLSVLMQFPEAEDYEALPEAPQQNNAAYTPEELLRVAGREEGSMDDLNAHENAIFEGLKLQYRNTVQERGGADADINAGADAVLHELRIYLRMQYQDEPAVLNNIPLPFDCNGADREARKAYYKNIYHTAYRYLFLYDNPLESEEGEFSMTNDSWLVLACLWLAIHDNTRFSTDSSFAQRREMFTNMVCQMARGHNHDRVIPHPVTGTMGYHDDMKRDKPTCARGVNKRMGMDACVILALKSPLTPENIKRKAQQEFFTILSRKIALLTTEQRIALRDALADLALNSMDRSELTSEQRTTLDRLKITAGELCGFTYACRESFGAKAYSGLQRAPINLKLEGEKQSFATYEALGNYYAEDIVAKFYVPLSTAVAKSLPEESPPRTLLNQFPASTQANKDGDQGMRAPRPADGPISSRLRSARPAAA